MNNKSILVLAVVVAIIAGVIFSKSNVAVSEAPSAEVASDVQAMDESAEAVDEADEAASAGETTLQAKVDHAALNNAPLSSDYVMGNADAPITLVEYASLSCPHCKEFHKQVLPKIKSEYIDTGKLKYILRQFPLNESAFAGAMLVNCVGEMHDGEHYYKFVNVLFSAQNKWAFDANFKDSLLKFAQVGGVTPEQFKECLNNEAREKHILETRKVAGQDLGVTGTPYIFLNGHPHDGNKSFKAVKTEIDMLLDGAK